MKIIDQANLLRKLCNDHGVYSINDLTREQRKEFDQHFNIYFNLNGDSKMHITKDDIGKKFITRDGGIVTVSTVVIDEDVGQYPVIVKIENGTSDAVAIDGKLWVGQESSLDLMSRVDESSNKLNITEADIGRTFISEGGWKFKIIKMNEHPTYKVLAERESDSFTSHFTNDGYYFEDKQRDNNNFARWEDDKENTLIITKEDIGKTFISRFGIEHIIKEEINDCGDYKFHAISKGSGNVFAFTEAGKFSTGGETHERDLVSRKEETQEPQETQETQETPQSSLDKDIDKFISDLSLIKDKDFLSKIKERNITTHLIQSFYLDINNIFSKITE